MMTAPTCVTRRQFLGMLGLSAAAAAAWKLGLIPRTNGLAQVTATRFLIGTVVNLTVASEDRRAAETAVAATLDRMAALEGILSRFRPDSQLSRLNEAGSLMRADRALLDLLTLAQEISQQSAGAFDITVKPLLDLYQRAQGVADPLPPADEIRAARDRVDYRWVSVQGDRVSFERPGMGITLDGVAKGYIVDAGVAVLREAGFADVLVEAGGDLLATGEKAPQTPWQIGIRSPRPSRNSLLTNFSVTDQAVATSGDTMQPFTADYRYHHILDPRTGYSAPELASATVLAPTAALADGLATAVMVLGPTAGLRLIESMAGCRATLVLKDLRRVESACHSSTQRESQPSCK